MNKSNIKSFVFAIVAVIAIGGIVGGSTFAYFQWTTGDTQKTNVNVTIEHGGITMHIEPEQTSFVGLRPTNDCTTNAKYGDALVTIVNNTGTRAIPSFKLKVKVTKGGSSALTSDALSHINYMVVPISYVYDDDLEIVTDSNGVPVKGYIPPCNSEQDIWGDDDNDFGGFFNQSVDWNTHLYFESVSTNGDWSHIPQCGDVTSENGASGARWPLIGKDCGYLPRQYFASAMEEIAVKGITFLAQPYATSYKYFRVYVWIDEGYATTTVGNTVSDPLQNAKIEITWSEQSMVQQVAS